MSLRTLPISAGGIIPINIAEIKEIKLIEYLGGGAYGSVWKVADTKTLKPYTLKIIQNIRPGSIEAERVRLEADVVIESDYVIPVVGLVDWDTTTFLILFEYFQGQSLYQKLSESKISDYQKKKIFNQILSGVADAHKSNIIHRDLKPANILVGDDLNVKIIDFGVSKFKGHELTLDGQIIGTWPYIAPEIIVEGAKHIDARADVYSLGHMFYEIVTGSNFWKYKGWREITDFLGFLQAKPKPKEIMELKVFRCEFYPNADDVLLRMTKINPVERFHSLEEVLSALNVSTVSVRPTVKDSKYPMLVIESGTNRNARTLININDNSTAVFGRMDFAGNDESISRRHLEFSISGKRYKVRDLNSKNGSMLSGITMLPLEWYEINHDDRIKVGDIFLRFDFTG
jgi:eukaryotic-like serine/threonine-protein kinase